MLISIVQVVLLALIASYVIWTVFMHVCTWYYFARADHRQPSPSYQPSVSIIKPTKGVDQSARENFRSFCDQEYAGEYELLFCVEEPSDPAVPIIQEVIEEHPDKQIRLIFSDPQDTRSFGKLKNMIAGVAASSYEVIVFSDSDARVSPTFLQETVACTRDPTIGLAFGAPAYAGSQNWAAALTGISVNELILRIATLYLFGLFEGAIGTAMVMRREVLERVGGLGQLGWQIADDIQLARIIRKQGYRIHLLKEPARVVHRHDRFRGWWAHMQRWLIIIRRYWPVHFLLMNLVDLALWWSILSLGIALFRQDDIPIAAGMVLGVLATSLLSATVVNMHIVRDEKWWRFLWVVCVQELLRLPLVIHSCLTNEIVWRGRRFRIDADGTTRTVETWTAAHDSA